MCGFAGVFVGNPGQLLDLGSVVKRMSDAIAHRGPDDMGVWSDQRAAIAFGHRRLAIVDLSAAGHQPMGSASGRFVIAFNGEIYNHLDMRAELEAAGASPEWRGHSDTETLLAAFEYWGIESTLTRTVGMFALALWDIQDQTLYLARDRFGEKPLYYGWSGGAFLFGSELKALRAWPGFDAPVCRGALVQYLRFMYVPAPRSIYTGVYKLEPGCLLAIRGTPPAAPPNDPLRPPAAYGSLQLRRWWSLAASVESGSHAPIRDEPEALERLEAALGDAVRIQSLADVPLGAFLSGGLDSSTIVALMQRQSLGPVKTFTVGFEEAGFDESPHARAVAQHLGTEHAELFVTAADARDVVMHLPSTYDEPFADSSQIPTYLVCKAARDHVTVALSGDGGDELFGGYNRYFWGPRVWGPLSALPFRVRQALGAGVTAFPISAWDGLGRIAHVLWPGSGGVVRLGDKAHKLAARLRSVRNMDDLYRSLVSEWSDPAVLVRSLDGRESCEPSSLLDDPLPGSWVDEDQLRMMYRDAISYLPDDILCKVDRAAMAVSLETRVPFLDHRVAELAWRLPLAMKIRGNEGKWALRQILYRYVPRELLERPKAGFGIPVGQWIRGPMREWAEDLLGEARLRQEGYLHPQPIRQAWAEHLAGHRDHTARLWSVLMFQSWLANRAPC